MANRSAQRQPAAAPSPVTSRAAPAGTLRPLGIPLASSLVLAGLGLSPMAQAVSGLPLTFFVVSGLLLAATALVYARLRASGATIAVEYAVKKQHWLQACAHFSIYAYWGWHWRKVYDSAWLIAAQIVFAYGIDQLLSISRRRRSTISFGPIPIIFSTNLFLWFKPEWFHYQFLLVAVGFAAKNFIQWERDGQPTHIFNPSSFPLALFSLVLLLTGTTDHTWGREIATTLFYPRFIFAYLFLLGLPGQFFFGVTTMTMSAVVTAYAWSAAYHAATGSYYFFDSQIPIAVFLGMHLLFTDPSTSPRRELGRLIFGVLYASGVIFLYWLLGVLRLDTFYDKLLPVPLLNLTVRGIDRLVAGPLAKLDPQRYATALTGSRRNLAWMTLWSALFVTFTFTGGLGDTHPGNRYPFWATACAEGRRHGCDNAGTMLAKWCRDEVGWACNELGLLIADKKISVEPTAEQVFDRGCEAGFEIACTNSRALARGGLVVRRPPRPIDYDHLLETKGYKRADNLGEMYQLACDQGWSEGCAGLAGLHRTGDGVARDPAKAMSILERCCQGGSALCCSDLGLAWHQGDGVPVDDKRALEYLDRACKLGSPESCRNLEQQRNAARPNAPAPAAP